MQIFLLHIISLHKLNLPHFDISSTSKANNQWYCLEDLCWMSRQHKRHRSRRIHSMDQAEGWTGVFDKEYMEWKFLISDLRATLPMELFTLCMNLPILTFFCLTSHLSSASHGQWGQENNLSHSLFCWSLRHVINNQVRRGILGNSQKLNKSEIRMFW